MEERLWGSLGAGKTEKVVGDSACLGKGMVHSDEAMGENIEAIGEDRGAAMR